MPYAFPDDLMQAQRDWYTAYRQLATTENPAQTTVLRRTLQRLSVRISTDPYWATIPGRAPGRQDGVEAAGVGAEPEAGRS
ncbi:hypothetical protein K9S39_19565 [Streptomyces halobius]|uniref:Uncharacterized protein n=2 Tax=Streptomyces halobius TaxID=2879846 RepID=A0ABY4MND8_9ACTN|nr:hypothetical protein [Streptomyces halobius]UQA97831.1 hypothetical protein K9S39_19565 [Streptomyces halobius]